MSVRKKPKNLRRAERPTIDLDRIHDWLRENASDVSIMWQMLYTGKVEPIKERFLCCLNVQEVK